eukprot:CAMPEP_0178379042 /NCGR_PEP_ID=MMETSP0689_2-20121128/4736_1 /TAXON_ID=160604 /ORGANISM="Amphidinium massartii, Strain CS-259" /LENGTH=2259 /DNA_ID=CAMNT_0019999127 /DNA_START=81 /DNA_END=6860 /DNA_ORIENTATION=-
MTGYYSIFLWMAYAISVLQISSAVPVAWQPVRASNECTCNRHGCDEERAFYKDNFFHLIDQDAHTGICEILWATMGCDCSKCAEFKYNIDPVLLTTLESPHHYCDCTVNRNQSSFDVQCAEVSTWPGQIQSGGTCTPVCPPGYQASEEKLTCSRGRLTPPTYSCSLANDPPSSSLLSVVFLDADPEEGYIAGRFHVEMGVNFSSSAPVGAIVYFGNASMAWEHMNVARWTFTAETLQSRWLERQAIPALATHLWAFPTNQGGHGTQGLAVPLLDLAVAPTQPVAGLDFQVALGQSGHSLRLSKRSTCGAKAKEEARRWRLRAKHTTTVYYWDIEQAWFNTSADSCSRAPPGTPISSADGVLSCTIAKCLRIGGEFNLTAPSEYAVQNASAPSNHRLVTWSHWSGRQDDNGQLWIGIEFEEPAEVSCASIEHSGMRFPMHALLRGDDLVLERHIGDAWEPVHGFDVEADYAGHPNQAEDIIPFRVTLRRPPGAAMARPVTSGSGSGVFRLDQGGGFTVCGCVPGQSSDCTHDEDFDQALASIVVLGAAQSLTAGAQSSRVLTVDANEPVRLLGHGLHHLDRLAFAENSSSCGGMNNITAFTGLDMAGEPGLPGIGTGLTWYVRTPPSPVIVKVCHWADPCHDLQSVESLEACRSLYRKYAVPLPAILEVVACRYPCLTCFDSADTCTTCAAGLFPFKGQCYNCTAPDCRLVVDIVAASELTRPLDGWLQADMYPSPYAKVQAAALHVQDQQAVLRSPMHMAAISPRVLLVANRLDNSILRIDMDDEEAGLQMACPACGYPTLKAPSSVRVSPTGLFWLIVDTGHNRVLRVDTSDAEQQAYVIAGSGPTTLYKDVPYFESQYIVEFSMSFNSTSSGDGGPAVRARLCIPMDVAIHRGEQEILILERRCQQQHPAVRQVDGAGVISTAFHLEDCDPASIDWRPGLEDSVIIACGKAGLQAYTRDHMGQWTFDGSLVPASAAGYTEVSVARWAPDGSLLVGARTAAKSAVVDLLRALPLSSEAVSTSDSPNATNISNETNFSNTSSVATGDESVRRLAGGGVRSLRGLWRGPWSDEVALRQVLGVAIAQDGSTYFADSVTAVVVRVRPPCGVGVDGQAVGQGYHDGSSSQRRGCQSCPQGQYNDGSDELEDKCAWCDAAAYETTGNICDGAVKCACLPGFHRNVTSGSCDPCEPGYVCRGYALVDEQSLEVEPNWTDGECYSAQTTQDWPLEECGGDRVSFDLQSLDTAQRQPLRAPGHIGATNPDRECDCCYGRVWNPRKRECQPCPEGLWCAGSLAAPGATIRVKDGYMALGTDRVYLCAHPVYCQWSTKAQRLIASNRDACNAQFLATNDACDKDHCTGVQIGGLLGICSPGRTGLACGQCEEHGFTPTFGAECRSCKGMGLRFDVAFAVAWLLPMAAYFIFTTACAAHVHMLGFACSLVGVSLCFAANIQAFHNKTLIQWWSSGEINFLEAVDWAAWYVAPVSLNCIVDGLLLRQVYRTCTFFIVPLSLLSLALLLRWSVACRARVPSIYIQDLKFAPAVAANILGMFASMLVAPMIAVPLSFFQCYEHTKGSHRWSMWSSPETLCYSVSWLKVMPFSLLGLILPTLWITMQLTLARLGPLAFLQATDDSGNLFRYQHLTLRFRTGAHYWELLTALRILALELVIAMPMGVQWQAYTLFLVNLLTLVFLVLRRPHNQPCANAYEAVSLLTILTTICFGLSLPLRDGTFVVMHGRDIVTKTLIVVVMGIAALTALVGAKDLVFAKMAKEKEEALVESFAVTLKSYADRISNLTEVNADSISDVVDAMDLYSLRESKRCLHYLVQFLHPRNDEEPSTQRLSDNDMRWTRLHDFEWRTSMIDQDIRSTSVEITAAIFSKNKEKNRSATQSLMMSPVNSRRRTGRSRSTTSLGSKSSSIRSPRIRGSPLSPEPNVEDSSDLGGGVGQIDFPRGNSRDSRYSKGSAKASSRGSKGSDRASSKGSSGRDRSQESLRASLSHTEESGEEGNTHSDRAPLRRSNTTGTTLSRGTQASKSSRGTVLISYDFMPRESSQVTLSSYPSLVQGKTLDAMLDDEELDPVTQWIRAEAAVPVAAHPPDDALSAPRTSDSNSWLRSTSTLSTLMARDSLHEGQKQQAGADADDEQDDCYLPLPTIRSERECTFHTASDDGAHDQGDAYGLPHESRARALPGYLRARPAKAVRSAVQKTRSQAIQRARQVLEVDPDQVDVSVVDLDAAFQEAALDVPYDQADKDEVLNVDDIFTM